MEVNENCLCRWLGRVCFLLILFAQAVILDHYLVVYEKKLSPHAFILTYIPAVFFWTRGQISNRRQTLAAAVWCLYSLPLAIIIGWIFDRILQKIDNDAILDQGLLRNTLAMSALVYLLLDVQDNYDTRLGIKINWVKVLDILDYIDFLGILLQSESAVISEHFKRAVVAFGIMSLLLTSVSLVRSVKEHDGTLEVTINPQLETARLLTEILLVNFPFCALRVFIWYEYKVQLSVFTFKNFLMIAVNLTQIVGQSFQSGVCIATMEGSTGTESNRSTQVGNLEEIIVAPSSNRRTRDIRRGVERT